MLTRISSMLDAIADRLEAQGLVKQAYEIDKIADKVEKVSAYNPIKHDYTRYNPDEDEPRPGDDQLFNTPFKDVLLKKPSATYVWDYFKDDIEKIKSLLIQLSPTEKEFIKNTDTLTALKISYKKTLSGVKEEIDLRLKIKNPQPKTDHGWWK